MEGRVAEVCRRDRLAIHVRHYPPGTSKWNKIEHRLSCHITQNWRGRPLSDRLAVVELIGATTTRAGLKVECALDHRTYEKGVKVSDAEMAALNLTGEDFHPEWNYSIRPKPTELVVELVYGGVLTSSSPPVERALRSWPPLRRG